MGCLGFVVSCGASMQGLLTASSASAPVTILTLRCSCSAFPLLTLHTRDVQASNAHPPGTEARHASVPLDDAGLTCQCPARCSMQTEASPLLQYITRPSSPLSCVGEYGPLMTAALGPVAPLIKITVAVELSSPTTSVSNAVCSRAGVTVPR